MKSRKPVPWLPIILLPCLLAWPGKVYGPNDKSGGPLRRGRGRLVEIEDGIGFIINFENLLAWHRTTRVLRIVDRLDPRLDLATFRPTAVRIGASVFPVMDFADRFQLDDDLTLRDGRVVVAAGSPVLLEIELEAPTREARWTFTALDPITLLPSEDPDLGFLPPNHEPPAGEGLVAFTIGLEAGAEEQGDPNPSEKPPQAGPGPSAQPPAGEIEIEEDADDSDDGADVLEIEIEDPLPGEVKGGTRIDNRATIRFDDQKPIETNKVELEVPPKSKD